MDEALPIAKLATLTFMMMGPIGLMPAFAGLTADADDALRRRIAVRAWLYASAALAIAVGIGAGVLAAWGATRPSLVIAAGLLLCVASLRAVVGGAGAQATAPAAARSAPSPALALSPLAFPTIVTPHGVGVLIVFVAYATEASTKATILGVALAVLALDLVAMLVARRVMAWLGPVPLTMLGAVFGVLQVALGIEMIASGVGLRISGAL